MRRLTAFDLHSLPLRPVPLAVLLLVLGLATRAPAAAQTPVLVTGTMVDRETSAPLSGAEVQLLTGTDDVVATATTDPRGRFRVEAPSEGRYALLSFALGYETHRMDDVEAKAPRTDLGTVTLTSTAFELNPIVITASRRREKTLDAPASVHVVETEEVEQRTATTAVDHVLGLPGVDVVTSGLARHSVAARGFNTTFNSNLLVLTDNRWAAVPSLRFNAFNLMATANEDIERIEVVLGPGAALYGSNTANGVLHVITKSPLNSQGTIVSLTGGERDLLQGTIRHAGLLADNLGFKVSGTYFRGTDWRFTDPVEAANRRAAIDAGADPDTLLIGRRNFDSERFNVDGRLDLRIDDRSTLTLSTGLAQLVSSIEQTTTNTAQAADWRYMYLQTRFSRDRLFAQAYVNSSDAGDTYVLRTGAPIVDRSRVFAGQIQHGAELGERGTFTYGLDFTRSEPRTDGTIHGRNEDDDIVTEIGGYLQSEIHLSSNVELLAAARVDRHDPLEETVFSPRAALVFEPAAGHNLRLTYNRAFQMPTTAELFADLLSSPTLGGLPFGIRVRGNLNGYTFRRDCGGPLAPPGLCMRSPFTPQSLGGPSQLLPLDVTPFWSAAVQVVSAQDPAAAAALAAMRAPDASTVGSVMRVLNPTTQGFDAVTGVEDVDRTDHSTTSTVELGYKGLVDGRLLLGVDLYYARVRDFISPAFVATPNVFLDPETTGAHIAAEAVRLGLPLDGAQVAALTQAVASVPLATVSPEVAPSSTGPADLILTFRNFGEIDYWGADLAATLLATERLTLEGTYSFVSENLFEDVGAFADVPLNAPRNKASVTVGYDDERRGVAAEIRGRWVESFPFASGVFVGDVESYRLIDAHVTYALPFRSGTSLTLTGLNLLNNRHRQVPGAPEIGRLVTLRLRAEL